MTPSTVITMQAFSILEVPAQLLFLGHVFTVRPLFSPPESPFVTCSKIHLSPYDQDPVVKKNLQSLFLELGSFVLFSVVILEVFFMFTSGLVVIVELFLDV